MRGTYTRFLTLVMALCITGMMWAQPRYSLDVSSNTFTPLVGGTAFTWSGTPTSDEGFSTATNIGFTFPYCGTNYTQFQVSTNGFLRFGADLNAATATDALSGLLRKVVAPLWDDLDVVALTNVTYQLNGSPGSYVLTVEWLNVKWNKTAAAANASFQVKLYEATGNIEFNYGSIGAATAGSASIGLVDNTNIGIAGNATGKYLSLNIGGTTGAQVYHQSMAYTFNAITTSPDANTLLTFTPQTGSPLSGTIYVGQVGDPYMRPSQVAMALNQRGVNGAVEVRLRAGTYDDILHLCTISGTSATNTVTIKNDGGTVTLSPLNGVQTISAPNASAGDAIVRLDGVTYVTLDGLSLIDNATNATVQKKFEVGILLANSFVASNSNTILGSRFNTMKNLIIDMNAMTGVATGVPGAMGIRFATTGSGFTSDTGKANSYNTIQDCSISDFWRAGIYLYGIGGAIPDVGNRIIGVNSRTEIKDVNINAGSSSDVRCIELNAQKNITIEKVDIYNIVSSVQTTNNVYGIWMNPASSTTDFCYGNLYMNDLKIYKLWNSNTAATTGLASAIAINKTYDGSVVTVTNCKIYDIYAYGNSTSTARALMLNIGAGTGLTTVNIVNNYVYDVRCPRSTNTTSPAARCLDIQSTFGGVVNANVFYNTFVLDNATPPTAAALQSANVYLSNWGGCFFDFRNNILVNTMQSASGKNVCLYASANSNLLRLTPTSDNNLYYFAGANGCISYDAATANTTLSAHKSALASGGLGGPRDLNAVWENPPFVATVSPYDYHIQTGIATQVEKGAKPVSGYTSDYDGNARDGSTPDIGADEGSFTQGSDVTAPVISYNNNYFPNTTSTSNLTLSGISMTDLSGIDMSSNKPRLYYKKQSDTNAFFGNTSTDMGWKWVEGTGSIESYSFTTDYSLLYGAGTVSAGDTILYFVVCQDLAGTPNVAASPSSGFAGTSVSAITSAPTNPNSYGIAYTYSGVINVGTDQAITTLSGQNGLFDKLNYGVVTGNLTINITTDLTNEDGYTDLNKWTEEGGSGYSMTIQSNTDTVRLIQLTTGVLSFLSVQNLTIDGGAGKYLRFRAPTYNVLSFYYDCKNIWLRNLTIESGGGNYPAIWIGTSTSTGNENITISGCDLRDRSDAAGNVGSFIYSVNYNSDPAGFNKNITIANNNFYNIGSASTTGTGINILEGNTDWTITGNSFYLTASRTVSSAAGLQFVSISNAKGNNFVIRGNYIGGTAAQCGGSALTFGSAASISNFLYALRLIAVGTSGATVVDSNVVTNIALTNNASIASGGAASSPLVFTACIVSDGWVKLGDTYGNFIGSPSTTGALSFTFGGSNASANALTPGNNVLDFRGVKGQIKNNQVGSINVVNNTTISSTGTNTVSFRGIYTTGGQGNTFEISNNVIGSNTTANSIAASGTSTQATSLVGISTQLYGMATVNNNTVANLSSTNVNTTTGSYIMGIQSAGFGAAALTNNTVHDLFVQTSNANASTTPSLSGIMNSCPAGSQVVTGNTIYTLRNTSTAAVNPQVVGYSATSSTGEGAFSKNKIYDLTNTATGTAPLIYGIHAYWGTWVASNNLISLSNAANTNAVTIMGVRDAANTVWSLYFNSILIGGSPSSGTLKSYGYCRDANYTPIQLKDNIFYNTRTNGGTATGNHFAVGNTYSVPLYNWSPSAIDYNLLYSSTSTTIGEWSNVYTAYNFSDWKTNSKADQNSTSATVSFTSATDLHLTGGSIGSGYLAGIPLSGYTTDFDNDTRDGSAPYKGYDEDLTLPAGCRLSLTAFLEGLYDQGSNTMISDTVRVKLRAGTSPYAVVDEATGVLNTSGVGSFVFRGAGVSGTSYYYAVYHRNSIETWSGLTNSFTSNLASYNFTTANEQSYGPNMIQHGSAWCIYTGDANQDGFVDFTDLGLIDNDSYNYLSGYLVTDLNGDQFVDFTDLGMCDNNSYNYIGVVTPSKKSLGKPVHIQKLIIKNDQ